jgi:hypothetical protein
MTLTEILLGIFLPLSIMGFSTGLTIWLFFHFTRIMEKEEEGTI